jgi:acetyl esterase/lipase
MPHTWRRSAGDHAARRQWASTEKARQDLLDQRFEYTDPLGLAAIQLADPADIRLDGHALGYLPPTYLVASDSELLRDDNKRLDAALRAQYVPVGSTYWPGQPHAFPLLHRCLPEARMATDGIRAWLDDLRAAH